MEVPDEILALLWEYSVDETSSGEGWENAIIEKVMERGCWDDMLWLLRTFDRDRLRRFIGRRGRRVLAPRELRFWAKTCGVPADEQDVWVLQARTRERAWRG